MTNAYVVTKENYTENMVTFQFIVIKFFQNNIKAPGPTNVDAGNFLIEDIVKLKNQI